MTDTSKNEAVEKLSQGIQESRQAAQQQTMKLAQEYFEDSVEELRQQVRNRRATLERLPDQVPGGHEESFQESFGRLMERYARLEACLTDARNNTDTRNDSSNAASASSDSSGRREEVDATDAARREAQRLGVDITQVKGTGSGGRIVVWDVTELAGEGDQGQSGKSNQASQQVKQTTGQVQQAAAGAVTEGVKATDAARRKAQEAGVDLSEVEGTGSDGNIIVDDVTNLAGESKDRGSGLGEDLFG